MLLEFLLSCFFHTEILLILLDINQIWQAGKGYNSISIDWTVYVFQAVGITFSSWLLIWLRSLLSGCVFFYLLVGEVSRVKSSAHWYQLNVLFFSFHLTISFVLWCSVFRNLYSSFHLTWKGLAVSFVEEKKLLNKTDLYFWLLFFTGVNHK